jgi:deoxyribonuclease-4
MGVTFEEIAAIIDAMGGDRRVGVCLDTAHLFEAGFDIRTADGLEQTLLTFDSVVGLDRLAMVHLNDSKTPLGSNRDRHENIGDGEIGVEGFRRIVNHAALERLPGIIEVPGLDGEGPDVHNMELLHSLHDR